MRAITTALLITAGTAATGAPGEGELITPCGGSFAAFKDAMEQAAVARGADPATAASFFAGATQDPATLAADGRQGVFTLPFTNFARRLISSPRIDGGRQNLSRYGDTFDRIQSTYGVSPGVITAFWAFETDYGAVQGDFNTVNSLMTLGHDCRRPELFQPQILAALALTEAGDLDPRTTTGAWAGEIGMVQMLPTDILERGVDGDGDGHVTLKTSAPDALMSAGNVLSSLGWRAGEPWIEEVDLPSSMDWSQARLDNRLSLSQWESMGVSPRDGTWDALSLPAALLLPQGKDGPAFVAYPNFDVFFEWNQSYTYVLTAAYFANRLEGAPIFDVGTNPQGLNDADTRELQRRLQSMGYDVGGIDGILGSGTRAAIRAEQQRLGLPADAWPTPELLNAL